MLIGELKNIQFILCEYNECRICWNRNVSFLVGLKLTIRTKIYIIIEDQRTILKTLTHIHIEYSKALSV